MYEPIYMYMCMHTHNTMYEDTYVQSVHAQVGILFMYLLRVMVVRWQKCASRCLELAQPTWKKLLPQIEVAAKPRL